MPTRATLLRQRIDLIVGRVRSMFRRTRAMIAAITRPSALDHEMDDEFALHIDLLTDDLIRRGLSGDEATRQARLAFGNKTVVKENGRAANGLRLLDTLSQDVRFTMRTLRKNAGFTAVAVLSLGFGIGAATTMFSVIDTLDFRALAYAGGDRLMSLAEVLPLDDRMCPGCSSSTAPATARDWLSQVRSYDALVVTEQAVFTWEHDDVEESPSAGVTTPGLLDILGLKPVVGRDLAATDTMAGAEPVVLLTYEFWETRFGRDPGVVGTQLRARMGGGLAAPVRAITIVGVMPKEFRITPYVKLWGALSLSDSKSRQARDAIVIGRLKPGIPITGATAELQTISARLARQYPVDYKGWRARVEPLRDRLSWGAGAGRGVLFGVTAIVLLVAVLNVTGLLFGRAAARQSEFAMRAALGASRGRLLQQLLVEGTYIGLAGGLVGVAFAFGGMRLAARWFSIQSAGLDLAVDHRMLAFAALLSLIVGVAAALAPALRTARTDPGSNLRPRVSAGARTAQTSNVLITAQIALAFMLLTAAGLLSRDFLEVRYLDLGYDPSGLFEVSVSGLRDQWSKPEAWRPAIVEARARVAAVHGIESASFEYVNAMHPSVVHSDLADESASDRAPLVKAVTADYFTTWRNPLRSGRAFVAADRAGAPLVAIVNRACASALWPGRNPLGHRIFLGDSASIGEWLTVIGVAEDVERGDFSQRHRPLVFRPFDQAPLYHASARLFVRLATDRPNVLNSAELAIREATGRRSAPFENSEEKVDTRYRTRRFNAIALDVFAGFGLLLAAMGTYGSIAFSVTQRTREIGIRVALGAARANVLGLIARRGVAVAVAGTIVGVAGSLALTRAFSSFVAATSVTNPWIFGVSIIVVLAVALVATLIPARRATAVNPVIALRAE